MFCKQLFTKSLVLLSAEKSKPQFFFTRVCTCTPKAALVSFPQSKTISDFPHSPIFNLTFRLQCDRISVVPRLYGYMLYRQNTYACIVKCLLSKKQLSIVFATQDSPKQRARLSEPAQDTDCDYATAAEYNKPLLSGEHIQREDTKPIKIDTPPSILCPKLTKRNFVHPLYTQAKITIK